MAVHTAGSSEPSRKYPEDVRYRQGLKPHSFCGLCVRAEALTHKKKRNELLGRHTRMQSISIEKEK